MLSVAAAQMRAADGDVGHNIREHIRLIESAAENRAGLIAFPEMSLTGYVREAARALCFAEDDARLSVLRDLAVDKSMLIIAELDEADTGLVIGKKRDGIWRGSVVRT